MNGLARCCKALLTTLGCLAFVAACGGGNDRIGGVQPLSAALPVAGLTAVAVTPASASVPAGAPQQFVATASFIDGTSRDVTALSDWTSGNTAIAGVGRDTGLATGASPGTAVISAGFGGQSGAATLTVTAVALQSVSVAPVGASIAGGLTRQYSLLGTYADGTTRNLSAVAAFTSSAPAIATIGASSGLATAIAAGTTVITASAGGMSASTNLAVTAATLVSIALTPAHPSVMSGGTQQMIATGTYSDATTGVLTTAVTWNSSDIAVATVLPTGVATGQGPGVSTLSATLDSVSGNTTLTVTAIPSVNTIALGSAASFGVLAGTSITNNSGGTTLVTGDVGSPSQIVDPTQAAGYTNYKSGAILAGALADLQTALADANNRPCDVNFAGGIDLGGQTFGPGVYCYAGAINITGTVTLSGPGLYLFRTALTLGTTANSIVALANGATADNVFFVPVGPAALGANSVFKGTLLLDAASATIGDNTTLLSGRVLSRAAVTLRNNQITKP
jgi:hypothetical protein